MISKSKRFIFIHIYKTAGTSISEVLRPHCRPGLLPKLIARGRMALGFDGKPLHNAGLPKHAAAAEYRLALGDQFAEYYRFSFVRNPFSWHVSLYHFIKQSHKNPFHDLVKKMTFVEYLDWKCHQNLSLQSDFLVDDREGSLVNHVGRVENLTEDFLFVCETVGVGFFLPYRNPSKHKPYIEYYSESAARLVRDAYAQDFERFGYSLDLGDETLLAMKI